MTDEAQTLLNRLTVLYGPPETMDPAAFVAEYRGVMSGYAPEIIRKAGDVIRDTHTRRSWPTPAEVREALTKAAPPPSRIDYDEIERERSMGWRFSDLNKSAKTAADRAAVQAMVDDWKRSIAERERAMLEESDTNFRRGQRDVVSEVQRTSPNPMHQVQK